MVDGATEVALQSPHPLGPSPSEAQWPKGHTTHYHPSIASRTRVQLKDAKLGPGDFKSPEQPM